MTNKEKVEQFKKITKDMADLYEKKNKNYGDSFGNVYAKLGSSSGLVPLYNKLDRLTALLKGNENNFESIEDSFIDLANYAIMNLIEYRSQKEDKKQTITASKNETITNTKTLKDYYVQQYDFYEPYSWLPWPCSQCSRRSNRLWTWSYSGTSINSNTTNFGCFGCKHYSNYTPSVTLTTTAQGGSITATTATAEGKGDK